MAKTKKVQDKKLKNLQNMTRLGYKLNLDFNQIYKISQKLLETENKKEIKKLQTELISIIDEDVYDFSDVEDLFYESRLLKTYIQENFKSEEEEAYLNISEYFDSNVNVITEYLDMFLSDNKPPLDVCEEDFVYDVRDAALNCKNVANLLSECAAFYYKQMEDEKVAKVLAASLKPEVGAKTAMTYESASKSLAVVSKEK